MPLYQPNHIVYSTKIDEASASVTYVGTARLGSLSSDESWQIKKISISGTVTTIQWAHGNDDYDNVWDDRAGLTYL